MNKNCTCVSLLENNKYFMDGYKMMPSCPNISSFKFPTDNLLVVTNANEAIDFNCKFKKSIDTLDILKAKEFSKGIVSEASWGETSGLYPTSLNKYNPEKWDISQTKRIIKSKSRNTFHCRI